MKGVIINDFYKLLYKVMQNGLSDMSSEMDEELDNFLFYVNRKEGLGEEGEDEFLDELDEGLDLLRSAIYEARKRRSKIREVNKEQKVVLGNPVAGNDKLLSVRTDVPKILGCCHTHVYNYHINKMGLRTIMVGSYMKVRMSDLQEYIANLPEDERGQLKIAV